MNENAEIPIRSFGVALYICRMVGSNPQFLMLRRASSVYKDVWQPVTGTIGDYETAVEAATREMEEETGLSPTRFYSTNHVESFYDTNMHCIQMVPVFVAFVEEEQEVTLSDEHSEYKWASPAEAREMVAFFQQARQIDFIVSRFVDSEPNDFLHIRLPGDEATDMPAVGE